MYTTCEFIKGSDIEYVMHSIYALLTSHKACVCWQNNSKSLRQILMTLKETGGNPDHHTDPRIFLKDFLIITLINQI